MREVNIGATPTPLHGAKVTDTPTPYLSAGSDVRATPNTLEEADMTETPTTLKRKLQRTIEASRGGIMSLMLDAQENRLREELRELAVKLDNQNEESV